MTYSMVIELLKRKKNEREIVFLGKIQTMGSIVTKKHHQIYVSMYAEAKQN